MTKDTPSVPRAQDSAAGLAFAERAAKTRAPTSKAAYSLSGHISPEQRFRGDHRCPICKGAEDDPRGHGQRCRGFLSSDGQWCHCSREEFAGQSRLNPGSECYQHRLKGKCPCGTEHAPAEPKPTKAKKPRGTFEVAYPYTDEQGRLLFEAIRFKDPKRFAQRRPNGNGGHIWKLDGVRLVPYRLPELLAADPDELVLVVEGEKDVDRLRSLGFVATCNPMGAGKWRKEYSEHLRGRRVAIIPDNDQTGHEHAQQVARSLTGEAAEIRIVELIDLPEKGDVSDFLDRGGTSEDLGRSIFEAPLWTPSEAPVIDGNGRGNGNGAGNGRIAPPPPPPPTELRTASDSIMPNEAADDPHRLARIMRAKFRHSDGPTLVFFRESFHVWDGACWRADPGFVPVILVNEVKAELDRKNVEAIEAWEKGREEDALGRGSGRPSLRPVARKVTRVLVSNVVQALAAMTSVDREEQPPFWINPMPDDPDPLSIMPARNGLVMLGPKCVVSMAHTPRYFSTYALPYDYQPSAGPPAEWLRFLESQWRNDLESIRELQKWFGLILTLEIKYQKMLLLIGPPRSGRSTIKDVMTKLIGRRNVAATSAVSLSDSFGLEPIVGKSLAIMGDARTADKHDAAVLLDRVLRITGCDPVEVNRKGKTILYDVLMRARFVVVSNEMPNFRDNSKAIVTRYLPLLMTESFEGREDYGLAERLNAELPSILNWAIEGRVMLHQDGRFTTPPSALGLLEDARSLASPVAEFVAEECELDPKASCSKRDLWERWKMWAIKSGHNPASMQIFGRNLRAGTNYKISDCRPRGAGDDRTRHWVGIDLKLTSSAGATPNASVPF